MSDRVWRPVDHQTVYEHPRMSVFEDKIVNRAGETSDYVYVDWGDSVFVIAESAAGNIALLQQHRYPIGIVQTEIIAGGLPEGMDPVDQARAEMMEEGCLVPRTIESIGSFYTQPARARNVGYVVHSIVEDPSVATVLNQEGDESILSIEFIPKDEVRDMMLTGKISGAYCLAALGIYWQHQTRQTDGPA